MTITNLPPDLTYYPESDGKPMTESDATRDYLLYCVEALELYFQNQQTVYVSGNLFIYYEQGNPKAVVSPDVFVVFGVSNRKRRSYQTWKEGQKLPDFIVEITSKSTRTEDERDKYALYARLGVQNYFQYDPTGDYLQPQLRGYSLTAGQYQPIAPIATSGEFGLYSQVLGLELRLMAPNPDLVTSSNQSRELRFFDPRTGDKLLTYKEMEQARRTAEQARQTAEQARQTAVPRLAAMGLTAAQIAAALELSVLQVEQLLTSDPAEP
jgi:Uma2 family endonuclease